MIYGKITLVMKRIENVLIDKSKKICHSNYKITKAFVSGEKESVIAKLID